MPGGWLSSSGSCFRAWLRMRAPLPLRLLSLRLFFSLSLRLFFPVVVSTVFSRCRHNRFFPLSLRLLFAIVVVATVFCYGDRAGFLCLLVSRLEMSHL